MINEIWGTDMATVAELQKQLHDDEDGLTLVAPTLATQVQMSPAARLLWIRQVLDELGVLATASPWLAKADALADRARDMRRNAALGSQQAQQRRASALNRLASDPEAMVAGIAEEYQAQGIWLDPPGPGGFRPIGIQISEDGARRLEEGITLQIFSNAEPLFTLMQKRAAEAVASVADLPTMPNQIWDVAPAGYAAELARWREHRGSFGVMTEATRAFGAAHAVAAVVRDAAGYSFARFPAGSTRTALWARQWRKELTDDTFNRIKAPLRLRYAAEQGWEPGVWKPSDAEDSTAVDRSFQGRLKNTGIAAGVPTSFPGPPQMIFGVGCVARCCLGGVQLLAGSAPSKSGPQSRTWLRATLFAF